jgi:O-antigen ligase
MKKQSLLSEWVPPAVIWIGSLYSMPQYVFIFGLICAYGLRRSNKFIRSSDFVWIIFIIFISIVNYIYGLIALPDGIESRHPYFLAYIFTFILATQLRKRDMQIIAYLIAFECGFVFLEMALGENTIFTSNPEYRSNLSFAMLYFARPFGLSDGTNTMGGKILIAIILSDYFLEKSRRKNLVRVALLLALIINFSRTAILAAAVHYFIYFAFNPDIKNKVKKIALILVAMFCFQLAFMNSLFELIIYQLNRGRETGVDLSYRDIIWEQCLTFIKNHPWFGNGSSRFHIWLSDYGAWEHAHNSFFHIFTTNGILIAGATLLWLGSRITKSNVKLVMPILIFSLGQYGIFWGISFIDIVFLFLILQRSENLFENNLNGNENFALEKICYGEREMRATG